MRRLCLLVVLSSLFVASISTATIFGTVRGLVHDPQHRPVPDVQTWNDYSGPLWCEHGYMYVAYIKQPPQKKHGGAPSITHPKTVAEEIHRA